MHLSVAPEILGIFPQVIFGVMHGTVGEMRADCSLTLAGMRDRAAANLAASITSREELRNDPRISTWHDAYKKFNVNPKRFNPTHEAFARRLIGGTGWPTVDPIVDVYLTNQVFHLLPHGGHDASALIGNIRLRFSPGEERFDVSEHEIENTDAGEIVYADHEKVLTRRWNCRDCYPARLTSETRSFVLVVELLSAANRSETLLPCMEDLRERYKKCFVGDFSFDIIEPANSTMNNS